MDTSSVGYVALGAALVLVGVTIGWRAKPDRVVEVRRTWYTSPMNIVSPPCDDGRERLAMSIVEGTRRVPRHID